MLVVLPVRQRVKRCLPVTIRSICCWPMSANRILPVCLAEDIAGGLMVTMPSEQDLRSEKIGPYVEKYLQGATGTSTENRMRILRLIENITLGTAAVGYRTESMHGAGSPQAQRIMISRQGNLAAKKELAKVIAKVDESKDRK